MSLTFPGFIDDTIHLKSKIVCCLIFFEGSTETKNPECRLVIWKCGPKYFWKLTSVFPLNFNLIKTKQSSCVNARAYRPSVPSTLFSAQSLGVGGYPSPSCLGGGGGGSTQSCPGQGVSQSCPDQGAPKSWPGWGYSHLGLGYPHRKGIGPVDPGCGQTHTCEKSTFPIFRKRSVITNWGV